VQVTDIDSRRRPLSLAPRRPLAYLSLENAGGGLVDSRSYMCRSSILDSRRRPFLRARASHARSSAESAKYNCALPRDASGQSIVQGPAGSDSPTSDADFANLEMHRDMVIKLQS
jgi:hypothetical protein